MDSKEIARQMKELAASPEAKRQMAEFIKKLDVPACGEERLREINSQLESMFSK